MNEAAVFADIRRAHERLARILRRRSRLIVGCPCLTVWITPHLWPTLWRKRKANGHTFLAVRFLFLSVMIDYRG